MIDVPSTLILAVPGTQETQELPREAVLEAVARGEILPDHWVWSPSDNDWKPLAEILELQAEPEIAPEPAPPAEPPIVETPAVAAMSTHFPPATGHISSAVGPLRPVETKPEVEVAKVTPALTETQMLARTNYSQPMEIKHEFPYFKVLFVLAFLAAAGVIGANYYLIEKPFAATLATTTFSTVPAYVHLGAFTQPGALVIHIPPSNAINADNFADYLVALARSTPPRPFTQTPLPYDVVGLTSSWQSQFLFNGTDWQKLAQMDTSSSGEKKQFAIEHLVQLDGIPFITIHREEDPAAVVDIESKAWKSLVANFTSKTP